MSEPTLDLPALLAKWRWQNIPLEYPGDYTAREASRDILRLVLALQQAEQERDFYLRAIPEPLRAEAQRLARAQADPEESSRA